MKLVMDVHIEGESARVAAVAFDDWAAFEGTKNYALRIEHVAKPVKGELDLRALPWLVQLLDAREDLLVLVNKLPALRAAEPPATVNVPLASLRARIAHAREALKASHDSKEILQMVAETGETFATIVAPLQAAGRWPKSRSR